MITNKDLLTEIVKVLYCTFGSAFNLIEWNHQMAMEFFKWRARSIDIEPKWSLFVQLRVPTSL